MHCLFSIFRTSLLYSSATEEVKIIPEKRTALVSIPIEEKDPKKGEKRVELIQQKCKDNNVKVNGSKSSMSHVIQGGGLFNKGEKETANLHWSCHIEGTNKDIGNLSEVLFKELGSDAPKVEYHDEEPSQEEFAKAEDEGLLAAGKRAKQRAKVLAEAFDVELVELTKISFNSYKAQDSSVQNTFDGCFQETDYQAGGFSFGAAKARAIAPPAPIQPNQISKAVVTVDCTYKIKSK